MSKIDDSLKEFREMDELSSKSSPIHRLNPLIKLIVTVFYIVITVSFDKYELSRLVIMAVYPVLLFEMSSTSFRGFFYKLRHVLPLVCAVGLINPFLDREVMLTLGTLPVTGGMISLVTLMLKGVFSLMASYVLVATTRFDSICASLRRLHVPSLLVTLMLLTYRYITIMMEEVSVMTTAYKLRAPGQKGIQYKAWGSFLGQLLLRSMDRAEEIYSAMQLRGFSDDYPYAPLPKLQITDFIYLIITIAACIIFKKYDLAELLGGLFVK